MDAGSASQEAYDGSGNVLGVNFASGPTLSYTYSDASTPAQIAPAAGLILALQDQFGRAVHFQYEQPAGASAPRISQVVDPSGRSTGVLYDANNNLAQLAWPDGKTRQYLYERADLPWAVTGIVDENGTRLATYGYDTQGRAIDTQWAGGADHYSVTYASPPRWNIVETYDSVANVVWRDHSWDVPSGVTITKPNGVTSALGAALVQGMPRMTTQSQPSGSGCVASSSAITYDANGNKASEDNFNGSRTCFVSDLSRNLETARVEGLANTAACNAVTAANATLPINSRKVSTAWHPDWRLATQRAEPNKLSTSVYNGQPDAFNGGAIASCAPSTALLPDGKPIAVLCKQVEQATTDSDGHLGFTAALQAGVPSRVQSYTYNQYGQVLTAKGPRADVNDTTTYAYYSATAFTGVDPDAVGHTMGDLQTVSNAVGKVTTFTKYNKAGLVLEMSDPNGVLTVNVYDARQRLTSTSVAGQFTRFGYDGVGQLKTTTLPNGAVLTNTYDDAHRLTQVQDAAGNKITYTLDTSGNRIGEEVKDGGGTLVKNIARSFDALNRLQSITGAAR